MVKISLEANSPSREYFETWLNQMEIDREVSACDMIFLIPSISRKYTGTRGYLTTGQDDAQRQADAWRRGTFTITFEKWEGSAA